MATSLINVNVSGFDDNHPGDPVAMVSLGGLALQAGETALWDFVAAVADLISTQQNVTRVVTTKYENVSTVV